MEDCLSKARAATLGVFIAGKKVTCIYNVYTSIMYTIKYTAVTACKAMWLVLAELT